MYGNMKPNLIEWDFEQFEPDYIVINLGTNDYSYCQDNIERSMAYQHQYSAFIKEVRQRNPKAKIICALGIMGDVLFQYMEAAVMDYQSVSGDDNITTYRFDVQSESDGYGVDYHPSAVTHRKAADALASFIDKIKDK